MTYVQRLREQTVQAQTFEEKQVQDKTSVAIENTFRILDSCSKKGFGSINLHLDTVLDEYGFSRNPKYNYSSVKLLKALKAEGLSTQLVQECTGSASYEVCWEATAQAATSQKITSNEGQDYSEK